MTAPAFWWMWTIRLRSWTDHYYTCSFCSFFCFPCFFCLWWKKKLKCWNMISNSKQCGKHSVTVQNTQHTFINLCLTHKMTRFCSDLVFEQSTFQLIRFCTMKHLIIFTLLILISQTFSQLFPKKRITTTRAPKKNNLIGLFFLYFLVLLHVAWMLKF